MKSKTFFGVVSLVVVSISVVALLSVYSHITDRARSNDEDMEVLHYLPMEPLVIYAPEYDIAAEPADVKIKVTEIRLSIFDTRINDQIKKADMFNKELDTLLVQLKAE